MSDSPVFTPEDAPGESPRHGFRGAGEKPYGPIPTGLAIAISREAGSRGQSVAKRAAAKLGWQLYSQELLEYMAQVGKFREEVLEQLPAEAGAWIEECLQRLMREQCLSANPSILELARMILALSVSGEVILLGRGAGCVLPARSTLNVRLIAPLPDRITYMSQWLRLTEDEAAQQVKQRDARRAEFLATHFHSKPSDLYQYDLVLNSSRLGEERCAQVIIEAARVKQAALQERQR